MGVVLKEEFAGSVEVEEACWESSFKTSGALLVWAAIEGHGCLLRRLREQRAWGPYLL